MNHDKLNLSKDKIFKLSIIISTLIISSSAFASGYGYYPGGGTSYTVFGPSTEKTSSSSSSKTFGTSLKDMLSKYCVPTVGNCDKKATYKENIIAPGVKKTWCDCANINKFYNSSNRSCENCILGSFATSDYKTCEPIHCPDGYVATLISKGVCPDGYTLQQINVASGCGEGYALKKYNPATKSFN